MCGNNNCCRCGAGGAAGVGLGSFGDVPVSVRDSEGLVMSQSWHGEFSGAGPGLGLGCFGSAVVCGTAAGGRCGDARAGRGLGGPGGGTVPCWPLMSPRVWGGCGDAAVPWSVMPVPCETGRFWWCRVLAQEFGDVAKETSQSEHSGASWTVTPRCQRLSLLWPEPLGRAAPVALLHSP